MRAFDEEKVKRFVADEAMFEAVFGAITDCYLNRTTNQEVNVLAAKTLALEFLRGAKDYLLRYKTQKTEEIESTQIGL